MTILAAGALAVVLSRLPSAKTAHGGYVALCPAHADRSPSLSVTEGTDGRVLVKCFAGCSYREIRDALGLEDADFFPPKDERAVAVHPRGYRPSQASRANGTTGGTIRALPAVSGNRAASAADAPRIEAETDDASGTLWPVAAAYDYLDADGAPVIRAERRDAPDGSGQKAFRQYRREGTAWVPGLRGVSDRPLYRLPELLEDVAAERTIYLVEGEKCVNALRALGYPATTSLGGANGWRPEYAEPLAGADVVILPDDDEPGRVWAAAAGESLAARECRVRMLALPSPRSPGLDSGYDVADWIAEGGTPDVFDRYAARATEWRPGDPVPTPPGPSRFRVYTDLELEALPPVRWLVDGMVPEAVLMVLYGEPGAGKSFVALDLACALATGEAFMGRRVLRTGPALYVAPEGSSGMGQRLRAWKRRRGYAGQPIGFRGIPETANLLDSGAVEHVLRAAATTPGLAIVVFDTLARSIPGGDENSAQDIGILTDHADRIRRVTGATVLLVHHTNKGGDIRGSTGILGNFDTLFAVRKEDQGRQLVCVKQKDGPEADPIAFDLAVEASSCVVVSGAELPQADPSRLTRQQAAAVRTLAESFLEDGASASEWLKASRIPDSTFYEVRTALVRNGYVTELEKGAYKRYRLSPSGRWAYADLLKGAAS